MNMALKERRQCIFCGQKPNDKTREHVLPYWLLEMTGDPRRVVTFGQNFERQKQPIRFSWNNYVAPACDRCNNRFSDLEGTVKPFVKALLWRETLTVSDYVTLLDWLDKVRIGVWLLQHMIEKHPVEISPHFHIASRLAEKDRMLAVYAFDGDGMGINMFGSDSLIFGSMPSCFGLRINNLLLLNVSADFFCSRGCGLPHPQSIQLLMDGKDEGKLRLEGFGYAPEISDPITDLALFKPVVWLYQPIRMPSDNPIFQGGFYGHVNSYDSRLASRTLQGSERQGALFRQYAGRVEVLADPSASIAFDKVAGHDSAVLKDIAASVYESQIRLFNAIRQVWTKPNRPSEFDQALQTLKLNNATELAQMYRDAGEGYT
jgi:hypothetical protein